jgi:hypothetical protein
MAESSILVLGILVLVVGAVAVALLLRKRLNTKGLEQPVRSMKPRGQDEQKFGEGENPPRQVSVVGSGSVFISYRRQDSADIIGRICDRLVERFGTPDVFKDVDTIPLGVDFRKYLQESVSRCDVLLAIIGKNWLEASNDTGKRCLDDPRDYLRIEIETALQRLYP